jgi:hypothetical protein
MLNSIENVETVLIICSEGYKNSFEKKCGGMGSTWEGAIITAGLYEDYCINNKYYPILPNVDEHQHIPKVLKAWNNGISLSERDRILRLVLRKGGQDGALSFETEEIGDKDKNPYRGLRFYDVSDQKYFLGRDRVTYELCKDIRRLFSDGAGMRMLALVGGSGTGKSSLARAGLIAQLKNGAIDETMNWTGSLDWKYFILTPGNDPLQSLMDCHDDENRFLLDSASAEAGSKNLKNCLLEDETTLHTQVVKMAGRGKVVLLIDQFEEFFTFNMGGGNDVAQNDQEERETARLAFVKNILYGVNAMKHTSNGPLMVILTLRNEFTDNLSEIPLLDKVLAPEYLRYLRPMDDNELYVAIQQPVIKRGGYIDEALTKRLMADAKEQLNYLPLLQYALSRLWEDAKKNGEQTLGLHSYERVGRIEGGLELHANAVFDSFSKAEKEIVRCVFLRLACLTEEGFVTRKRIPLNEFMESERLVIYKLTSEDSRLLVIEGQMIDVVHEVIFRHWSMLREWIAENEEALRLFDRLRTDAIQWKEEGNKESYLYRKDMFRRTLACYDKNKNVLNIGGLETEFLKACKKLDNWLRLKSIFGPVCVIGIVLLTLIGAYLNKPKEGETAGDTQFVIFILIISEFFIPIGYVIALAMCESFRANRKRGFLFLSLFGFQILATLLYVYISYDSKEDRTLTQAICLLLLLVDAGVFVSWAGFCIGKIILYFTKPAIKFLHDE